MRISWFILHHYRAFRTFTKYEADEQKQHVTIPKQFAQSLLELRPLFVKLGQILSTRPDVLPEAYITELARLQEHVPPFPFAQVRTMIKEQFDKEIDELFHSFEEHLVAAASLAQVHLAVLKDGTPVAVKMQRPFAKERITADKARGLNLVLVSTSSNAIRCRNLTSPSKPKRLSGSNTISPDGPISSFHTSTGISSLQKY